MKLNLKSLLKNEKLLYVLGFLGTFQLMGFLMLNQTESAIILLLVGFLTTFFTKNMIIVFFVAMLVANIASTDLYKNQSMRLYEGMSTKVKSKSNEVKSNEEITEGLTDSNIDCSACRGEPVCLDACKKSKVGFQNRLAPAKFNKDEDDDDEDGDAKPNIDYASTVESAYDNLDKILDSDALKAMSQDSQRLIEKQQKLMSNMKNIQPMMSDITKFLKGFDVDKMSDMFSKFSASDESKPEELN